MSVGSKKGFLSSSFIILSLILFMPVQAKSEFRFESTTTDNVITLNAPKDAPVHVTSVGGAFNFIQVDSDFDDAPGGVAISRYTYRNIVSVEGTASFNEFDVDVTGFDGDVFGVPLFTNLLFHSPWWNNIRFYVMGGIGFQFNDADVDVDLSRASVDGKVVTLPTLAGIEDANNRLIEANGRVSFLSSSTSTTTGATTTTSTAAATEDSTIARDAALAAARADANLAAADLAAARNAKETNLKDVVIPAGTASVNVDIDDGFVYILGAGVDIRLAENLLGNIEVGYQVADFDVSGELSVPGLGIVKVDDELSLDAFLVRIGFLIEL